MIRAEKTSGSPASPAASGISVKVATYKAGFEPEVTEISASNPASATEKISSVVERHVRELSGNVPVRAVKEVVENLIHADYQGVVISVMDGGNTVRVSDRGPGIVNKARAQEFGFSGATAEAAQEIRGIGAGLGIARSAIRETGGTLLLEDNLGGGTVVTLSTADLPQTSEVLAESPAEPQKGAEVRRHLDEVPKLDISERQEKTLLTVLECGEVGPSTIAEMIEVSVSTAYRDLSVLEDHGLARSNETGKRVISPLGRDYAEAIIKTWVK